MIQFSIKRLLIYTALIALAIWLVRGAYLGFTQVESGEVVASVDWLPKSASNVSYYRSYMNTAYEFDIDEADFLKWSRWGGAEITEPVRLRRYLAFSTPPPPEPSSPTNDEMVAFAIEYGRRGVTIRDGLYYGYLQTNSGGVWVGYNRSSGRAYYHSAPR